VTWHWRPPEDGRTGRVSVAPSLPPAEAHDRKERKREARRRRDAQRYPDSRERFKILLDVIAEQRHVVSLEDHRARYAMNLMGAINAAMFLIVSRALRGGRLPTLSPWVLGVALAYAVVSLVFILAAVDCLRPRVLERKGLLHWEGALMHGIGDYQAAWSEVRMNQLNREAVVIAHMLARMIQQKYRANRRLYGALTVLTALGAVLLAILGMLSVLE
jgi:hypothetical protein